MCSICHSRTQKEARTPVDPGVLLRVEDACAIYDHRSESAQRVQACVEEAEEADGLRAPADKPKLTLKDAFNAPIALDHAPFVPIPGLVTAESMQAIQDAYSALTIAGVPKKELFGGSGMQEILDRINELATNNPEALAKVSCTCGPSHCSTGTFVVNFVLFLTLVHRFVRVQEVRRFA